MPEGTAATKFDTFRSIFYEMIDKDDTPNSGLSTEYIKELFEEATRQTKEHFRLKAEVEELKKQKKEIEHKKSEADRLSKNLSIRTNIREMMEGWDDA